MKRRAFGLTVAVVLLAAALSAHAAPDPSALAEAQKKAKAAFKPIDLPGVDRIEKQLLPSLPKGIVIESGPFDALIKTLQSPYDAAFTARAEALKAIAGVPSPVGGELVRAAFKVLAKEEQTIAERIGAVEKAYATVYDVEWNESSAGQKQTRQLAATLIPHYRSLQRREEEVAALAAEALGAMREGESLAWLVAAATSDPDAALRATAADALGLTGADAAREVLAGLRAKDAAPAVRLRALAALFSWKTSAVADAIVAALSDAAWEVRALAIEACVRANLVEAVEPMIEALGRETGRLRKDLDDALFALVGARMYGDVDLWKRWWSDNREEIAQKAAAAAASPDREKALGPPAAWPPREDAQAAADDEAKRKGGTSAFYGITTQSKRVLFVIDISKSMEEPTKERPPASPDPKRPYAKPASDAKIDVAKWQLHRAIQSLPDDATFGIVVYSESYAAWPETMAVMTAKTRMKAHAFVDGIRVNGTTNVCDSLDEAFDLAAAGLVTTPVTGGTPGGRAVDTVFLLSDGAPNRGRVTNLPALLEEATARNRTARLVIHAVGIGAVAGSSFLENLAKWNGGRYVGFP